MNILQNNRKLKQILVIGIASAIIIGLTMSVTLWSHETMARESLKEIKSSGWKATTELYFNICGEENDPKKVFGTSENPALLKRGSQIVVQFCVLNADTDARDWIIKATDSDTMLHDPQNGIHVNFTTNYLSLPSYTGESMHYHDGKGNAADFNAIVAADKDAPIGVHSFMVQAQYPTVNGTIVNGKVVYVNVEQ